MEQLPMISEGNLNDEVMSNISRTFSDWQSALNNFEETNRVHAPVSPLIFENFDPSYFSCSNSFCQQINTIHPHPNIYVMTDSDLKAGAKTINTLSLSKFPADWI